MYNMMHVSTCRIRFEGEKTNNIHLRMTEFATRQYKL